MKHLANLIEQLNEPDLLINGTFNSNLFKHAGCFENYLRILHRDATQLRKPLAASEAFAWYDQLHEFSPEVYFELSAYFSFAVCALASSMGGNYSPDIKFPLQEKEVSLPSITKHIVSTIEIGQTRYPG